MLGFGFGCLRLKDVAWADFYSLLLLAAKMGFSSILRRDYHGNFYPLRVFSRFALKFFIVDGNLQASKTACHAGKFLGFIIESQLYVI